MTSAPLPASADAARVTPMMEQYIEIKAANPDALLFYRMGDFYELFFEDAEVASRALGIVLTKRGRHQGDDIPMCGVPIVRSDEYLHRLIALGYRVAICEQLEDPAEAKKRGSKSVVKRDVVRLVTAGTITEETLLEPARANLLVAVSRQKLSETQSSFGLAAIDISTGTFRVSEASRANLAADLARLEPSEILYPETLADDAALVELLRETRAVLAPVSRDHFDRSEAEKRIAQWYGLATLDGLGTFSGAELAAMAGALRYVERTQRGGRPPLDRPSRPDGQAPMAIDAATRANLELTRTLGGERSGSLLATIDRTVTAAGARLLAHQLASPLTEVGPILARLDAVDHLKSDLALRTELRSGLKTLPDMVRSLARLALQRGGPRDLAAIRDGLNAANAVCARLEKEANAPEILKSAAADLARLDRTLPERLKEALADETPLLKRDGGFIRSGFEARLDETRSLRDESRAVIAGLQTRYVDETGIRQIKIRHNNLIGYFIEVPQDKGDEFLKPPLRERFAHRQTMAGAMRFSTAELADLETRIANAADRALALELAIFDDLAKVVLDESPAIKAATEALAALDVAAALATLAEEARWTRPVMDGSTAFAIESGRHPVVEAALKQSGKPFVANDCDLSGTAKGRLWLLTGPNMAGKSTFLRQNALIAILAQMGSFVPAKSAHIGIVDRLFSRVGAADDLARGRSTFMVEMVETAAILNQAGPRSLVILDEIGRGTATYDGLSIAWATLENLHSSNACRALFATHYHELTQTAKMLTHLFNATMRVTEWNGDVVFLHEVAPGAADRSYGIQVAKLAGLPTAVIERARTLLAKLEAGDRQAGAKGFVDDLPLFAAPVRTQAPPRKDPVIEVLDSLDPNDMSPKQALDALFQLKQAREMSKNKA